MIRSVEFDLVTKIEPNARFASRAGMFAKSKRVKDQRAAVRAVLRAHLIAPPLFLSTGTGLPRVEEMGAHTMPNRITVRLTRIAPGRTADAWENLRAALKAVKDEVAAWIGVDDREGGPVTWLDPAQEKGGQHVYRVRIEVTDDAPGDDRRVVLAETASAGRAAKSRVKRFTTKAAKGATKVRAREHTIIERSGDVVTYHPEPRGKRKATDLRNAAERVFARKPRDGDEGTVRRNGTLQAVTSSPRAAAEAAWSKATKPTERLVHAAVAGYGPGVQAEAEALAAMTEQAKSVKCPTCPEPMPAPPGKWCFIVGDEPVEYGVHASRARAAGLPPYPSVAELNAGLRPVRVQHRCEMCAGKGDLPAEEVADGFKHLAGKCIACHGSGKVAAWEWQPQTRGQKEKTSAPLKKPGSDPQPAPARPDPDAETMTAMREQARSVPCPEPGCLARSASDAPTTPDVSACRSNYGGSFEYGVHAARARAAGLPPYPSAAELNAGLRPARVERPCTTCKVPGFRSCQDCHGSGKVAAWEWQPRSTSTGARSRAASRETRHGATLAVAPPNVPHRDPGEERPARDIAPCTTCGVRIGLPCIDVPGAPDLPRVFGVHEARAKAAGLNGVHTPPRAPTNGTRKLVPAAAPTLPPQAPPTAYLALPWEQPRCLACVWCRCPACETVALVQDTEDARGMLQCKACGSRNGVSPAIPPPWAEPCGTCKGLGYRVTRLAPLRLPTVPDELSRLVPPEHQARYGVRVTLTRTRLDTPQTGATWLFTMTTKET